MLQVGEMGLFTWLTGRKVSSFGQALADDILRRYPPGKLESGKQPSAARITRVLETVMESAIAFQAEHRLGWLGKARLANAFRWRLEELGYPSSFVQVAVESLLVYVSRKPSANDLSNK